jgi:hypothetical protein
LIPERKMVVIPFNVDTVQLANAVVVHPITLAATPVSVSFRLFQFTPEALVKNRVPKPLDGTPNVKFCPTETHPGVGQAGSRMMIVGSRLEVAEAAVAKTAKAIRTNKMRVNLVEGFTSYAPAGLICCRGKRRTGYSEASYTPLTKTLQMTDVQAKSGR